MKQNTGTLIYSPQQGDELTVHPWDAFQQQYSRYCLLVCAGEQSAAVYLQCNCKGKSSQYIAAG